jgi:hypothetical protein
MQSSADGKDPRVPVVLSHSNPGKSMYAQVDGACVGTAVGWLEGSGVDGAGVGSELGAGVVGAGVGEVVGDVDGLADG